MPTIFEQRCIKTTVPPCETIYCFQPITTKNDKQRARLSHYSVVIMLSDYQKNRKTPRLPTLPPELWLRILNQFLPDLALIEIIPSPKDTSLDIPQEIHGHRVVKMLGRINDIVGVEQNPTPGQSLPTKIGEYCAWNSSSLWRPNPSPDVFDTQRVDGKLLESFPAGDQYIDNIENTKYAYLYKLSESPNDEAHHLGLIVDNLYPNVTARCTIPNGINEISSHCFANAPIISNPGSDSFQLPSSVVTLAPSAFFNCAHLTMVDLSLTKITNIRAWTFEYCSSLKNMALPTTVTEIKTSAFSGCPRLTTINLEHVTAINESAFSMLTQLQELDLRNARDIDDNAFVGSNCQTVKLGPHLANFDFIDEDDGLKPVETFVPRHDTANSWINASEGKFPLSMLMKLNREHMIMMDVPDEKISELLKDKECALQIHGILSSPPGGSAEATTVPQSGMLPL